MDYLEAAVVLKQLISKTNSLILSKNSNKLTLPNLMNIRSNFGDDIELIMDSFSNNFVNRTLNEYESEAFVITDFVTTEQNQKRLNYFLYKGYSSYFNKGLVFFQLIDINTYKPIGNLEFSNLEDNIFYKVDEPDFEESSCNAIETKENTAKNPCIAFLIGHMNEERLIYDIQRLIFDTANNIQKHKNRNFKFIIQIDKFGSKPSKDFHSKIECIKYSTANSFALEYPNCEFVFSIGDK